MNGDEIMRWTAHKSISSAWIILLTGNPLAILPIVSGAVYPDKIEGICLPGSPGHMEWKKRHRTFSHRLGTYILSWTIAYGIFLLLWHFGPPELEVFNGRFVTNGDSLTPQTKVWMLAFFQLLTGVCWWRSMFYAGAVFHCFQDMFSGNGVPFWHVDKKIGIRLHKTGDTKEALVTFVMVIVCVYAAYQIYGSGMFMPKSPWPYKYLYFLPSVLSR